VTAGGEVPHTVAFALAALVASTLMELPWSWYQTFVLEQRHGFNTTTKVCVAGCVGGAGRGC